VPGADVQPDPVYFSVICFGALVENVCSSVSRGDRVVVAGRLEEDTWTGRVGVERLTTKLIADAAGKDLRFAEPGERTGPRTAKPATSSTTRVPADDTAPQYDEEPF
jgi:single-strand DNA-binding protein